MTDSKAWKAWWAAALALGLAVGIALPLGAWGESNDAGRDGGQAPQRTIAVSGHAVVRSAADEAVISLGVERRAETAGAAMGQNAAAMQRVFRALSVEGIERAQIGTTLVSLRPVREKHRIIYYSARNQIEVRLPVSGTVGKVIDGALGAGATLADVSFRVSQESGTEREALEAAVADAKRKAEAMAAAGGASLGSLVAVEPLRSGRLDQMAGSEAASWDNAKMLAAPVASPRQESQVFVTVVWELV